MPDETKDLTIETVQEQVFLPVSQFPPPDKRKNGAIYWTKMIFHNQLGFEKELWLSVWALTSQGYLMRSSGEIVRTQTGLLMLHKEKTIQTIKRKLANYLPIQLKSGEKATLYIKNEYGGHLPKLKEIDRIETPVNARLSTLEARSIQNFSSGFFQALLLILILYCLFYAFYSKEKFAIYLVIFCLLYSLHFLNADGYLYEYSAIKNKPVLFNLSNLILVNLAIIFESLFIQQYLSLKIRLPKWNKAFNGVIVLDIIIIGLTTAYYLITKEYRLAITAVAFFQLAWLVFRPFFLVKIWWIKDIKIRIFAFAGTLGFLLAFAAWITYLIPGGNGAPLLKLSVGSFTSIIVISLSYYAAKSRTDKLRFEKENIESQLILEQQRNKHLAMEKEKAFLQLKTEDLERLYQLKSRFFANVSHELRTPLTLILSPIGAMLKGNRLGQRDFTFAKMIQQNAKSLLSRVNEILDLTKLESSKMELKEEKVLIYPFLKRVVSNFESIADDKAIQLAFQYNTDEYLQIELDAGKFEKVVQNLLANALKFTPNGGEIKVALQDEANYLILKVMDNGRGINPKDLPNIFDAYFQSALPDAPIEGGTGIGLALCKEFARLMKADLTVESEVKKGSTFMFKFPKKEFLGQVQMLDIAEATILTDDLNEQKMVPIVKRDNQQEATTEKANRPRILIVEDNQSLRQYIHQLLNPDYQTIITQNGQQAWDYLNSTQPKPALILSDIMMPEMDGYQLLKKLKEDGQLAKIPVIMLTALADLQDKLKALRIGVDDYMLKPFEEEELMARVKNLLKHSVLRQQFIVENPVVLSEEEAVLNESADISTIQLSQTDVNWLADLEKITLKKLGNVNFFIEQLATEMTQSRWQLNRRLKVLTGLTASQYLLETRLNQARTLLEQGEYTSVKSVIYTVGIKDVQHFSRQFKERFGKLPSEYL